MERRFGGDKGAEDKSWGLRVTGEYWIEKAACLTLRVNVVISYY